MKGGEGMNDDIKTTIDYVMPYIMQRENSDSNIRLLLEAELERLYSMAFNKGYELQNEIKKLRG